MPDNLADLSELMESYRRRARAIPFGPISGAYADAADELEAIIAELGVVSPQLPPGLTTGI